MFWTRRAQAEIETRLDGIRHELSSSRAELAASRDAEEDLRTDLNLQRERAAEFDRAVPRGIQIAAAWSWRVLLIAALIAGIGWLAARLSAVTIPLAIGIMLAAGLVPIATRLMKWGVPRPVAAVITLVGGLLIVSGFLTLIVSQIAGQADELGQRAMEGFHQLMTWLNSGPLQISQDQINGWLDQITKYLREQQATIARYATTGAGAVGNFLAGMILALFAMFFMLYDGPMIWKWLLRLVPGAARERVDGGGKSGWNSLVEYVRATVIVAAVDAIFPLIAALIMGVPMAPALGALLFLSAFVPIVGILVSGAVVTLITLVTVGPIQALIMLGVIVIVNQLEGNVLQPMLLGKAVSLHPLAVIFGITIGISVGGIVGALLVVPMMAFAKSFIGYAVEGQTKESEAAGVEPATDAEDAGLSPAT
ncbi:MAG: AI-2E family transporter [Propionibacteriaceae bacterium]|nr:AI-2E family transporter [Propionibacteriaceae bacterium]